MSTSPPDRSRTTDNPETQDTADVPDPERHRILGQYLFDPDLMLGDYCRPEDVHRLRQLQLHHDDVIIASYPKTGTMLLQECVWLILHRADVQAARNSYAYERTPFLDDSGRDNYQYFYSNDPPRTLKSHLPYRLLPESATRGGGALPRIVYIYRNPRDTLVSYYHFYRSTRQLGRFPGTWDQFFAMFHYTNRGLLYYGNFYDHLRGFYTNRDRENLLIVSYEEILTGHSDAVLKLASFLGVSLTDAEVETVVRETRFESMQQNPSTNLLSIPHEIDPSISAYMRKGRIGDWRNYFSQEQLEQLAEMEREKIGDLDIQFIYE